MKQIQVFGIVTARGTLLDQSGVGNRNARHETYKSEAAAKKELKRRGWKGLRVIPIEISY